MPGSLYPDVSLSSGFVTDTASPPPSAPSPAACFCSASSRSDCLSSFSVCLFACWSAIPRANDSGSACSANSSAVPIIASNLSETSLRKHKQRKICCEFLPKSNSSLNLSLEAISQNVPMNHKRDFFLVNLRCRGDLIGGRAAITDRAGPRLPLLPVRLVALQSRLFLRLLRRLPGLHWLQPLPRLRCRNCRCKHEQPIRTDPCILYL